MPRVSNEGTSFIVHKPDRAIRLSRFSHSVRWNMELGGFFGHMPVQPSDWGLVDAIVALTNRKLA